MSYVIPKDVVVTTHREYLDALDWVVIVSDRSKKRSLTEEENEFLDQMVDKIYAYEQSITEPV